MSFSLCHHCGTPLVSVFEIVFFTTLFLIARYGPRLGRSLDDLSHLPGGETYVRGLFEVLGWLAAIVACVILAPFALMSVLFFFSFGLGLFVDHGLARNWIAGIATVGPLVFSWLRWGAGTPIEVRFR